MLRRRRNSVTLWTGALQIQIWRHPDEYHFMIANNGRWFPFSLSLQVWR